MKMLETIKLLFYFLFSHQLKLVVFNLNLSDSKSLQFSKTVLIIRADLNNSLVSMVSILPLTSRYPSFFSKFLRTIPSSVVFIIFIFQFFQLSGKIQIFVYHFTYYYYHYCYYLLIRVFHISVSWWYFNGDWVTASLLKSPGLFSVFWPFSIMLLFGWSPLGRQFPNLPGPLIIL